MANLPFGCQLFDPNGIVLLGKQMKGEKTPWDPGRMGGIGAAIAG